jgi:hypothetical protein
LSMKIQERKWAFPSGYGSGELRMSRHLRSLAVTLLVLVGAGTSAALAAPPPNDAFVNATTITSLPFSDTQNTVEATTEPDDPDCYGNGPTVWYAFTPGTNMRIAANTFGSDYDTTLSVYTGGPGSFNQIACNDDAGSLQSRVVFDASAGETYFFMAGAFFGGPGGNLAFSVVEPSPPPNDDFADAIVAGTLPFSDTENTLGATRAGGDPTDCFDPQPTVWYAFTPSEDMRILAHTSGSDYEAVIGVYTGEPGSFLQVACSYFGPALFEAAAGETYFFMVGPVYGEGGYLTFSLQQAPPALTFDVRLDRSGSFDKTGQAVVRGTAICNQPTWVNLWGSLRQPVGRLVTISGDFYQFVECNGATPWKVTLTPGSGKFAGGRADASVYAEAWTEFEWASDDASAKITLQGGKRQPGGKPNKPKK